MTREFIFKIEITVTTHIYIYIYWENDPPTWTWPTNKKSSLDEVGSKEKRN